MHPHSIWIIGPSAVGKHTLFPESPPPLRLPVPKTNRKGACPSLPSDRTCIDRFLPQPLNAPPFIYWMPVPPLGRWPAAQSIWWPALHYCLAPGHCAGASQFRRDVGSAPSPRSPTQLAITILPCMVCRSSGSR